MAFTPAAQVGGYQVVAKIGSGGMGDVYRARDIRLGREVAIKVLAPALANDPDYMTRFQREAQALASLNHPNIAVLYGIEELDGVRALVMELLEGATLADRIAEGPIPLQEALEIARQIAEALEAAHEKGIIHRDLKPANVKITPQGLVKVLDFGLAKVAVDPAASAGVANSPTLTIRATQAGLIMGTAAYMSPEQARGSAVDKRADIWAFGVVLLEMLTGRQPFVGDTVSDTLAAVLKTTPDWSALPAETPAPVRRVLRHCIERNRKHRLADIADARLEIEEALNGTAWDASPAPSRAPRLPWIAAGLAVAAALTIGIVHFSEPSPRQEVLRYELPLSEGSSLHSFAVSPDARYLAITAAVNGRRELWIRPFDQVKPHSLPGTEGATFPFWSPDSRHIGFFAQGKLKRVPVEGGPPQAICDAPYGRGGTWNKDGVVVFAPSNDGGLQRVQAAGGVPVPVTQAATGAVHRFPVFLPDGRRFLYLLSFAADPGVYVGSLDSNASRRLVSDESSALWAQREGDRSGFLVFERDGVLMAQPMDSKSLRPSGEIFPMAEQVKLGPVVRHLLASVGGGILVHLPGRGTEVGRLLWYERHGKPVSDANSPIPGVGPMFSPDGRTLALVRYAGTDADIWLRDLVRGSESRLTFNSARDQAPVWSPDGRRIAFQSNQRGAYDLYLKNSSASGEDELLVSNHASKQPLDWSRDGRFLLYRESGDLWILENPAGPPDGRKQQPFLKTPFAEGYAQFSPDGKWVAYSSDETGQVEIYVRPFPSGPAKWKVSIGGGDRPVWRGDGRELFYLAGDRRLTAVAVRSVSGAEPALEFSAPAVLFEVQNASEGRFPYAVSADGKRFVFTVDEQTAANLNVTLNWLAAAKK